MIVETMTHEEVYQELERDRESISNWWHHTLEAQRRRAMKTMKFPLMLSFEHTSPRRNKYIFFTRIFDKRMKRILTGILVPRRTQEGLSAYTTWLEHQKLISPVVILPHAFKRYAERCCVEKTGLDLITHFFTINNHFADSHNQRIVGKSVRYNGEEHVASCMNEGILLGQQQGDLLVCRTFITYDMCSGLQQKVLDERRKEIYTDEEMYKNIRKCYN